MEKHSVKEYAVYEADEDAEYDEVIEIDLGKVRPTVAFPHLPGNGHTIDEDYDRSSRNWFMYEWAFV